MSDATRVLLVEDDPDQAGLVRRTLRGQEPPYAVTVARDAATCFAALTAEGFDVVLLDYSLPGMTGLEVLDGIRSRLCTVPVIMVTGQEDERVAVAAMKAGAIDYVIKTGGYPTTLPAVIEKVLRQHALGLENQRLHAETQRQLREAEAREAYYRSLIENGADLIAVLDAGGAIRYASPSHERVLGHGVEELLGRNFTSLVHADDVVAAGAAGNVRAYASQRELRVRHRDGSWRWLATTGRDALADPAVGGVVLSSRDMTEQRQLEARVRQSQKMEAIGRLAAGMAHDFNNLLAVIMGYGELALNRLAAGDPRRDEWQEILKAGGHGASLTRQLLAFSRQQLLRPEALDLSRVVGDLERMLRRLIGEDVRFVTALQPDLAMVKADRGQLEQVLMNLVVNARDAMPHGGTLTIETTTVPSDGPWSVELEARGDAPAGYVMLAVTDTGCGMDAETRARIFEPFFTTKTPGQGTGLGLATVYGIVEQSGGFISVESEVGRGSTFRIYLPQGPASAPATPAAPVASGGGGTETVMLVEDDRALRDLIHRILADRGYAVLAAGSGPEALRLAHQHGRPIDLLVTDIVMPEMSGPETADRLVAEQPHLKVLYMSGYTDAVRLRLPSPEVTVPFLQKPFAPSALALKVREVLSAKLAAV